MAILIEQTQIEMQDSHAFSRRAEIAGIKVSAATFSAPKALPLELEEALTVAIRYAPQDALISDDCVRARSLADSRWRGLFWQKPCGLSSLCGGQLS